MPPNESRSELIGVRARRGVEGVGGKQKCWNRISYNEWAVKFCGRRREKQPG